MRVRVGVGVRVRVRRVRVRVRAQHRACHGRPHFLVLLAVAVGAVIAYC